MKCVERKPHELDTIQIDKFTKYENFCGYRMVNSINLNERNIPEKYRGLDGSHSCEYCDDGYCMKKTHCKDCVKVGYVTMGYEILYPLLGDYIVYDDDKIKDVLSEKEFNQKYRKVDD